jgi:hypothetical protein
VEALKKTARSKRGAKVDALSCFGLFEHVPRRLNYLILGSAKFDDRDRRLASPPGTVLINSVVYDAHSEERSTRLGAELRLVLATLRGSQYEGRDRVFIAV